MGRTAASGGRRAAGGGGDGGGGDNERATTEAELLVLVVMRLPPLKSGLVSRRAGEQDRRITIPAPACDVIDSCRLLSGCAGIRSKAG